MRKTKSPRVYRNTARGHNSPPGRHSKPPYIRDVHLLRIQPFISQQYQNQKYGRRR